MSQSHLVQFTLFPNLPREIRLSIWEASLCPRIVEMRQKPVAVQTDEKMIADRGAGSDGDNAADDTQDPVAIQPEEEQVTNCGSESGDDDDDDDDDDTQSEDAGTGVRRGSVNSLTESLGWDDFEFHILHFSNPNPFYSPTPLPAILQTSRESRASGLEKYILSFPNGDDHPARIYYHHSLDTLYFPDYSWWEKRIRPFELAASTLAKSTIRSIAIERQLWFCYWEEGSINCQLQIDEFPNLAELQIVSRLPDPEGCACCSENHIMPDHGVIDFVEDEMTPYNMKCSGQIQAQLERIKENKTSWNPPSAVRFMRLKRDGKFI